MLLILGCSCTYTVSCLICSGFLSVSKYFSSLIVPWYTTSLHHKITDMLAFSQTHSGKEISIQTSLGGTTDFEVLEWQIFLFCCSSLYFAYFGSSLRQTFNLAFKLIWWTLLFLRKTSYLFSFFFVLLRNCFTSLLSPAYTIGAFCGGKHTIIKFLILLKHLQWR